MKIVRDLVQGSPEWVTLRSGMPSASNFDKLVTSTGARSKQAEKYILTLAGERIIRGKEQTFQSFAMERGIEMEETARSLYEMITGETVDTVGLCIDDTGTYCCSPDGLVGDDGGLEIKCPMLPAAVQYLLDNRLPVEYYQQVQGSMLVTERKWWDFMSFYPGMKPLIVRCERNEAFIASLKSEIIRTVAEVDRIEKLIA